MDETIAVRKIAGEDRDVVLVDDGKYIVPVSREILDRDGEAVVKAMARALVEKEIGRRPD